MVCEGRDARPWRTKVLPDMRDPKFFRLPPLAVGKTLLSVVVWTRVIWALQANLPCTLHGSTMRSAVHTVRRLV
jgi:hypothetical protein